MMDLIKVLLSPISITFLILIFGWLLGKIKFCGISLDLSCVLIIAVVFGCVIAQCNIFRNAIDISTLKINMQTFSSLGTALFISVIGITTGYSLDLRTTRNIKAFLIGATMVGASFAVMKLIAVTDEYVSYSKLCGAFCGALTTTPGLSAVNELKDINPEETVLGYGCTYMFGVVATVISVQFLSRKAEMVFEEKEIKDNANKLSMNVLLQIGIVVVLGRLLGNVQIGRFSLGNSGGTLCAGIILGYLVKTLLSNKIASNYTMGGFRDLGLLLFFCGNGIPAGISLTGDFDMRILIYGALMTIIPIITGTILTKVVIGSDDIATIVAGGMTSTPAIAGLLKRRCPVSLASYSMAYMGALVTIIIVTRFL